MKILGLFFFTSENEDDKSIYIVGLLREFNEVVIEKQLAYA